MSVDENRLGAYTRRMKNLRAPLALLLSASVARADVAQFPLWNAYGPAATISRDGYHHVKLDQEKRRVLLDGKEVYRTATPSHDSLHPIVALSDDGSSWAFMRAEADEEGRRRGLVLTINGREIRRSHKSARELKFSPNGGNLAYIAQSDDGNYSVVSAQGAGPSFDTMPGIVALGEQGVLYYVDWQGRRWLYRDHNPLKGPDYHLLASTPDLSRVLATYKLGGEFGASIDGAEIGRWPEIADPLISSTGKAAFFFSTVPRAGGYDRLYVDGKTSTIPSSSPSDVVFNSAGVFWHTPNDVYRGAERIGSWLTYGYNWAAASPSGRRWAFLAVGREGATLVVDGRELEPGLPSPLFNTAPVFDGEKALHYLGTGSRNAAVLVCVTLDEAPAARGACARKAAGLKSAAAAE